MNTPRLPFDGQDTIHHALAVIEEGKIGGAINIIGRWRENLPDVKTTIDAICNGLSFQGKDRIILAAAATLATEKNENPYHGNGHFLEVFFMAAILGQHTLKEGRITPHQYAVLLTAALIHDYKHDGTNNAGVQYRLEDIAINESAAALKEAGMNDDTMRMVAVLVRSTDVSKNFADPSTISPSQSLYKGVLKPELNALGESGVELARILRDSDIGSSMISTLLGNQNGKALADEAGKEFDPNSQIFFFRHICEGRAVSESGKVLIQPYLNQVLKDIGIPSPANVPEAP